MWCDHQELFWLAHNGATQREPNNQTNQTQRHSPGFSHSSPQGARPVNAHSETPTLLLSGSRPPCRNLHVSGSPPFLFPYCMALISRLGRGEQRWPLPESTEMEETEFLT
ncbi:hypothetical protein Q8A67_012199 [Cirrhinus molitorella]|uniref:Uncharacterized protein n=1 Tax=Cirrhinus molitorella TaxID=172907 RepID=A0AA88Q0U7_9TELE|nr:hypothetical protein Q8A67_012199 [Cirrhinus molitorella]